MDKRLYAVVPRSKLGSAKFTFAHLSGTGPRLARYGVGAWVAGEFWPWKTCRRCWSLKMTSQSRLSLKTRFPKAVLNQPSPLLARKP